MSLRQYKNADRGKTIFIQNENVRSEIKKRKIGIKV